MESQFHGLFLFLSFSIFVSDFISFVVLRNTAFIDIIFIRRYAIEALENGPWRKGFQGVKVRFTKKSSYKKTRCHKNEKKNIKFWKKNWRFLKTNNKSEKTRQIFTRDQSKAPLILPQLSLFVSSEEFLMKNVFRVEEKKIFD